MTVVIQKKHTKETRFDSLFDDPLMRALKEQHKELNVIKIFDGMFECKNGSQYSFDDHIYSRPEAKKLASGVINQIRLEFNQTKTERS